MIPITLTTEHRDSRNFLKRKSDAAAIFDGFGNTGYGQSTTQVSPKSVTWSITRCNGNQSISFFMAGTVYVPCMHGI